LDGTECRMLLAKVKRGGGAVEDAARKLKSIGNKMPKGRPPRLVVLTRGGGPIVALGP